MKTITSLAGCYDGWRRRDAAAQGEVDVAGFLETGEKVVERDLISVCYN